MFKFIHAADIHLDSPLRGLDKYEGAPVEAIRGATRKAFSKLVDLAIDERVAFIILAGDIYDGDWQDYNTGLFFVMQLRKLDKARIPVVMLYGNHDAQSRITKHLTLPDNTRPYVLLPDQRDFVTFDTQQVAIFGRGYANQAETRNLASEYLPPKPGYFNIGVLHTALDGREGHEPYAPCTREELLARRYDYWALGHVHQRESVNGSERIRVEYPGNVQGRHIRETGAKGCLLVTVDSERQAIPEFRSLDVFRWEVVPVDAPDVASTDEALDASVKALTEAKDLADGRSLAARVKVSCIDAVYRQIADNLEQFRCDLAGQVGSDIWVEKIKLTNISEERQLESTITGDAASELRAVLAQLRSIPGAAQSVFAAGDCGKLKKVLLPEVRDVREATGKGMSEVCDLFEANRDEIFDRAEMLLRCNAQSEDDL